MGNSAKRPCAWCGQEFQAQRVTAKFCGGTCRQRANRAGSGAQGQSDSVTPQGPGGERTGLSPDVTQLPGCPSAHQGVVQLAPGRWVCGRCRAALHTGDPTARGDRTVVEGK